MRLLHWPRYARGGGAGSERPEEPILRKLHTGHGLNNLTASERAPYGDTLAAQLEEVALALS